MDHQEHTQTPQQTPFPPQNQQLHHLNKTPSWYKNWEVALKRINGSCQEHNSPSNVFTIINFSIISPYPNYPIQVIEIWVKYENSTYIVNFSLNFFRADEIHWDGNNYEASFDLSFIFDKNGYLLLILLWASYHISLPTALVTSSQTIHKKSNN